MKKTGITLAGVAVMLFAICATAQGPNPSNDAAGRLRKALDDLPAQRAAIKKSYEEQMEPLRVQMREIEAKFRGDLAASEVKERMIVEELKLNTVTPMREPRADKSAPLQTFRGPGLAIGTPGTDEKLDIIWKTLEALNARLATVEMKMNNLEKKGRAGFPDVKK